MVFRFYRKGHRRCEVRKTWSIERLLLSVQGYFVVIVFGQKEGIFRTKVYELEPYEIANVKPLPNTPNSNLIWRKDNR